MVDTNEFIAVFNAVLYETSNNIPPCIDSFARQRVTTEIHAYMDRVTRERVYVANTSVSSSKQRLIAALGMVRGLFGLSRHLYVRDTSEEDIVTHLINLSPVHIPRNYIVQLAESDGGEHRITALFINVIMGHEKTKRYAEMAVNMIQSSQYDDLFVLEE